MNRLILNLSRLLLIGLVSFIVIAAVAVGIGRQFVANIHEFHSNIESNASQSAGVAVKFASISGQWEGLTTTVRMTDLQLRRSLDAAPFIAVDNFSLELNLGASFLQLQPVIKLWVDGAAFDILYQQGKFHLVNGPESDAVADKPDNENRLFDRLDFLFQQPHIQLTNSHIQIKGFWPQDVAVTDINLGARRQSTRKQLWGKLTLTGENSITAVVAGEFSGQLTQRESLNGHLYVKVDAPQLAPWMPLPASELTSLQISKASGEIEFWGKLAEGNVERVTSRLLVSDVEIKQDDNGEALPTINRVAAIAKWEGDWYRDWHVAMQRLQVEADTFRWSPQQLVLHSQSASDNERVFLGELDQASLGPWVQYYASFLDPQSKAYASLRTIQPNANIENLVFEVKMDGKEVADFQIEAKLSDVTTQTKRWIPGVNHINANVLLGKYLSIIEFNGAAIDLHYPSLFRTNLMVDKVQGALMIHNLEDEWIIESGLLKLSDEHVKGITQLAVSKQKASDLSPYLRLQATLEKFDAANLYEHLPAGVIPGGVVRWIDSSVKKGQLLRGDLLFHGPTDLYEFEPFQYVLGFTLSDTQLQFLDDWRPVDNITADIRVESGAVDAWATNGEYYGGELDTAWVGTKRIASGDIDLEIKANLSGRVEDTLQILLDSPIQETTKPIMEKITATGDAEIAVDIKLPFRQGDTLPLELTVNANVDQGQLGISEQQLDFTDLSGRITYDIERGLSSPGLQGSLFNGPISATITTLPDGDSQQTLILTRGSTQLAAVKPWLKLDMLAPLSGKIGYRADVYLRNENDEAEVSRSFVEVTSDLVGVTAAYPPPLNKSPEEAISFTYKTSLGGVKNFQSLSYGDLFDLQMVSEGGQVLRGALGFAENARLPNSSAFVANGRLTEFNLDAWQQIYKEMQSARQTWQQPERSVSLLEKLGNSRLFIDSFMVAEQVFPALDLHLTRQNDSFRLNVDSELLAGQVTIPRQYAFDLNYRNPQDPIKVHLAKLAVTEKQLQKVETIHEAEKKTSRDFNPSQLPPLQLRIDQLTLADDDFGSWQIDWVPVSNGINLEKISFDLKHVRFKGTGSWLWQGDHGITSMRGEAKATNVAKVLTAWGYAPSLTSDNAKVELAGQWQGAPYDFDLLTADAKFNVLLKDGRFRDVSSGTADKVLGFLNFEDWLSRMRLKIQDLESNEMPYNQIEGDFVLSNKVLAAKNLKLDGAALKMAMDGKLNLENKQIKADLDVTIPVTRNLVLPAAAVGGLPAAATVYVIEKVLGSQLDKLTTMKYTVEGPFADPSVALKESFNIIPKQIQESIVKDGANGRASQETQQEEETEVD